MAVDTRLWDSTCRCGHRDRYHRYQYCRGCQYEGCYCKFYNRWHLSMMQSRRAWADMRVNILYDSTPPALGVDL